MENYVVEVEAAERLGITRQTLRNWRKGYEGYPARLVQGEHWKKLGNTVFFDSLWVEQMEDVMRQRRELLGLMPVVSVNEVRESQHENN